MSDSLKNTTKRKRIIHDDIELPSKRSRLNSQKTTGNKRRTLIDVDLHDEKRKKKKSSHIGSYRHTSEMLFVLEQMEKKKIRKLKKEYKQTSQATSVGVYVGQNGVLKSVSGFYSPGNITKSTSATKKREISPLEEGYMICDQIMEAMRSMEFSPGTHQKQMMNRCLGTLLPFIFGTSFVSNKETILKKYQIEQSSRYFVGITPRQSGKTTSMCMFIAVYLLCCPGADALLFSKSDGLSKNNMTEIIKFFNQARKKMGILKKIKIIEDNQKCFCFEVIGEDKSNLLEGSIRDVRKLVARVPNQVSIFFFFFTNARRMKTNNNNNNKMMMEMKLPINIVTKLRFVCLFIYFGTQNETYVFGSS